MSEEMKPQLHQSMLGTLYHCGIQFQRRYGARFGIWHKEEIIPPSIALAIGSSVHHSIDKNLSHKFEHGEMLAVDEATQFARDYFLDTWDGGMLLTDGEAARIDSTKGEGVDMSVALSRLHHAEIAPDIVPLGVEEKFLIVLEGYPFDIAGKNDIREKDKVRDTKTAGKRNPHAAKSMQMRTYSLGHKILHGSTPKSVQVDVLLKLKTPQCESYEMEPFPDDQWYGPLYHRIERMAEMIELVKQGKMKMPAADADAWCCDRRWCGYAFTCPAWSGR